MGSFWGRCEAGPRGRGGTVFWFFFLVFCVHWPFCRALPTPQQRSPSPLPRSLIGGEILIVEVSFVLGGFGGGARGKGEGRGARGGKGDMRCFLHCCPFSHAPPCCRNPSSISPAWPFSYRDACTLPHLPRGFAQLRWAVVATLASGLGFLGVFGACPLGFFFCERLFADL